MPDWTKSMQRTYEYYVVDPKTWRDTKLLTNVKTCAINRDSTVETRGSASFVVTESVGECYVRAYLITNQNGVKEKHPLGTFLVQTPSSSYDGRIRNVTMDAYTPLIELKENKPPIGYSILEGENVMERAYLLCRERARAPVVKTDCDTKLASDFVADPNSDTWLTYLRDLISNAKFKTGSGKTRTGYEFDLDEMGRILFAPKQDTESLQPVWTFDDSNSSILYPDLSMDHDLYGIPNVVEVIYSNGNKTHHAVVENNDVNSPISIPNRGRKIIYRVTNPDLAGESTEQQIKEYAEQLLKSLSTIEYSITYSHGYCPVRVGDCVRINYTRAGLTNIKAKVISQSIDCDSECKVTEKAVFTTKLWG